MAEWRRAARELPVAKELGSVTLIDHIPELLDEIAEIAEQIVSDEVPTQPFETARRHALDRLAEGFDIWSVVRELSLLRGCILETWERTSTGSVEELRAFDLSVDRAIAVSVGRYAEAHERTLAAIDRISTASLSSHDIDELLRRMLAVFMETTPAVDTAAILLRDGDRLILRASVGLDLDEAERTVAIGEGFSGEVAALRAPIEVRCAYTDPRITSPVLRRARVRALYGVPLIHEGRVIGVAHMGSITAHEFSPEDRQFFGSLAGRATLGIAHHVLRQQLAESEERYKHMVDELRVAVRMREDVLSIVSHDLRGPLGTVTLSAAMLESEVTGERGRRQVTAIQRACARMETMINDLLDTASIREGRLQLDIQTCAAEALLVEALELQQECAADKGIALVNQCSLAGIEIACDHDRVLQVFANLIGNALKFCRGGDTITVNGEVIGSMVKFIVADDGPGIGLERLPHLFEMYWSAAEHVKRGSGVGLYIARGIVEGHGGTIGVVPGGKGARFAFTLPIATQ
jgi:signal transduction histidine kinase